MLAAAIIVSLTGCGSLSGGGQQGRISEAPQQEGVETTTGQQGSGENIPKTEPEYQLYVEEAVTGIVEETAQPGTPSSSTDNGSRVLVAYFSCTGRTRPLAEYAADALGAAIYEIQPEVPYTSADLNYGDNSSRSSLEQNDAAARPLISGSVENMEQYDIVFLAYPIWWGEAPRIINTFLESYDFSGKTIIPFCTSSSSGIGSSATNLHGMAGDAVWLSGARLDSGATRSDLVEWINSLGLEITAE